MTRQTKSARVRESALPDRMGELLAGRGLVLDASLVNSLAEAVIVSRGVITWCNDRVKDVLGYSREELIGKDAGFFLARSGCSSKWAEIVHQVTEEGGVFRSAARVKRKDGSVAEIEFSVARLSGRRPAEYVSVARDVTDRKAVERAASKARMKLEERVKERTAALAKANRDLRNEVRERQLVEEELRRREEYHKSLIRNARDVIVVLGSDGTIQFESEAIETMLGYKAEEVVGMDGFTFVHPEDVAKINDIFGELLRCTNSTVHVELRVMHRDGSYRVVDALGQNLLDDPAVAGIVASFRDITEHKTVEEEKHRMQQQLQLAGRLAAVGELAAGVAHELNNPLAAVQAYAQLLSSKSDLDESLRNDVNTIYREAQRAARITQNLLSFSRRHRLEKKLVSINEVIERSLELHAYRMRVNNIEVSLDLDPELPMTMADFHQMQQVFVNIITNAEQAMTEAHKRGRLVIRSRRLGDRIQVTFADDGPGIPEQDLEKIFDPFFTTKEVGEGTGLGLSICYGIVHEHGGLMYARSRPGEGSTFTVELPISIEEPTSSDSSSQQLEGLKQIDV